MDQIDRYDPDAFDFLGPPFAAPAGGDLLLTVPQEDALSAALNALGRGSGLVVIGGDAGSGRTLVADALADALRARGLVVDQIARLGGPGGSALLARLAPLLGIAPSRLAPVLAALAPTLRDAGHPGGLADARGAAARGLASGRGSSGDARQAGAGVIDGARPDRAPIQGVARAAGQPGGRAAGDARPGPALAVVVDDAGTWPEADLLLLASLAGLRLGDAPLLQAVLIGDASLEWRMPALRETAARPAGSGDGGSEAVSLRIPPLTRHQGEEYLSHRFAAAGGSLQRTMSPGAIDEILLRCGGNPGRIDQLADDCLAITARRRRRYVTSTVVRTARQPPRARRRLPGPLACTLLGAAGGLLAAGAGVVLAVHGLAPAVPGQAGASRQGDAALFAGTGRFAVPVIPPPAAMAAVRAAPLPYTQDYPAQGFAPPPPPVVVPPAPPARVAVVPPISEPGAATFPAGPVAPRVAAATAEVAPPPLLVPRMVPLPGPLAPSSVVADAPPALPTPPPWPAQAGPAAGPAVPRSPETAAVTGGPEGPGASPARDTAAAASTPAEAMTVASLPLPGEASGAPLDSVGRAPPAGHRDGPVVMHVARPRDTTVSLLRRIWGGDDQTARTLFRSLNPGIDAQGPWPAGTVIAVPLRLRARTAGVVANPVPPRLVPPRPVPVSRPPREVARDNPAGQVQSGVPYFCRSIVPQNGAEDDYIRQVCGR